MKIESKKDKTLIQPSIAIVNTYTLIAAIYCACFAILFYVVIKNIFLSTIHLLALISVAGNFFLLQKTKNFQRATNIILATGTTVVLSLFATGGWENTGYLWPFAYLPFAFFLTRGTGARNWVFILFAGSIILVILHYFKIINIPYSPIAIFNYFAALFIFTLCMFQFQRATINYEEFLFYTGNLMELSPDPFIMIDKKGKITDANRSTIKLTGLSLEKLIGSDFSSHFIESLKAWELCEQVFSKGFVYNYLLSIPKADGSFIELLVNATTYEDRKAGAEKIFAIGRDITEQRKSEEALKQKSKELEESNKTLLREISDRKKAESHLQTKATQLAEAQQLAHIGSWEWNVITNHLEWSDELYRIWGLTPQQFVADYESFLKYIHPDDREFVNEKVEEAFKTQEPFQFVHRIVRPNGMVRIVSSIGTVFTDNAGNIIKMAGSGQDITEIKKAEEEIRSLSVVASSTSNSVMVLDENGTVQWVNDAFIRLTGYQLKDVEGKPLMILRKGEQANAAGSSIFEKLKREKTPVTYETKNYSKEGKEYWIISTLTPILNDKGEVQKIIAIDSDITRLKETEDLLINAKERAENSEKVKEQFLANMSHEIRTPMNAIIGFTRLLEEAKLSQEQQEWLSAIKHSGENLLTIINDILDFAKIEAGKFEFVENRIHLADIIQSAIAMLKPKADEKKLPLLFSIDNKIPSVVLGDSVRLTQILLNLISNAIKFSSHGEVSIEMSLLNETAGNITVQVSVADTGIGIREEELKNIFQSFTQANAGISQKYGGTGLGLAITKKLVESQGGMLTVQSKYGEGSCFLFVLQFNKINLPEQKKEISAGNLDMEKVLNKNVLLVEDNLLNQQLAKIFLERWKMNVDIADNGKIAINKLDKKTYDIILMDLEMPEMNGYETTYYIRGNLQKNVPIIAMTAHALKGEADNCIMAGMNDHISKPFNPDDLLSKIIYHIERNGKPEQF